MQNANDQELDNIDGGTQSVIAAIVLGEGTFGSCLIGGGWAGGFIGISLCGAAGVITGILGYAAATP